jgi:KUP system potassium uptake protein
MKSNGSRTTPAPALFLAYLAIGGVLGDIGTSPLYVMALTFKKLPPTLGNVMGVLSLIVWSFVFLSAKYAWMALSMDNNGEGGTFALLGLIRKEGQRLRQRTATELRNHAVAIAGIFSMTCGALLLSDGVITPAISVLAAVEGVQVVYPHLAELVIPAAVIILTGLFSLQKRGTERIARLFSPVILIWFVAIGAVGVLNLTAAPGLLKALNPYYAIVFIFHHPLGIVFPILGYVVLCITGGEALYADEAHYSRPAIRLAWAVAAVCLLANYFGQGAFILTTGHVANPFFDMSVPLGHAVYMLLLVLATLAAIIASQAMITGSYSTYKQAMELRMLPRLEIRNTSTSTTGQIYIPWVNWGLFGACLATIFIFQSSDSLGNAYGLAVTGAFIGTTLMMGIYLFLHHYDRRKKFMAFIPLLGLFLLFDAGFFFSNLGKIPTGGWFPLCVGTFLVTLMIAWEEGSNLLYQSIPKEDMPTFTKKLKKAAITLIPGTRIYMNLNENTVPATLLSDRDGESLRRNCVLVTVKNTDLPWGIRYDKKEIASFHDGQGKIYQVIIEKGYMRLFVNVPNIMDEQGFKEMPKQFVFGFWNIQVVDKTWRRWLLLFFRFIHRNSPSLTQRFMLPAENVAYTGGDIGLQFPAKKAGRHFFPVVAPHTHSNAEALGNENYPLPEMRSSRGVGANGISKGLRR